MKSKIITKQMRDSLLCSNCGKPTGGRAVMSPSLDPKRRNQCIECSKDIITDTSPSWRPVSKQTQDWEKDAQEFMDKLNIMDIGTLNSIVYHKISQALSSQLEEVKEWVKSNKMRFGDTTDYHMFLSKIQEMKGKV